MHKRLALLLVSAMLSSCAGLLDKEPAITASKAETTESEQDRRDAMVGNWIGEAPLKEGGSRKWLVQRSNDGTYAVTFVVMATGEEAEVSQEVGFWGISGPIYFSITKGWLLADGSVKRTDPSNAYFYDAYKIVELTPQRFEYESFSTGNRFIVEKVAQDYTPNDLLASVSDEA